MPEKILTSPAIYVRELSLSNFALLLVVLLLLLLVLEVLLLIPFMIKSIKR